MSFISQLNWRYATKKFDSREVPAADLEKIVEAIRMAPTSYGLQPFHVTVVRNSELREKLKGAAYGQEQLVTGSHVLVFSTRTDIDVVLDEYFTLASGGNIEVRTAMKGYEDMAKGSVASKSVADLKAWTAKQAYIALGFGLAAAAELEIDAAPMEGFDPSQAKEILALKETLDPVVLLVLGYRDPSDMIRPKTRFPAEELFDTRA